MAPRLFSKLFSRRKEPPYTPSRLDPDAIGIHDSTCAINGDPTDQWFLPVPSPDSRQLSLGSLPYNPQRQSSFFERLPPEVRDIIYLALFGGKRIHVDHVFRQPIDLPSNETATRAKKGKKKQRQPEMRWQWWHHVCLYDAMYRTYMGDQHHEQCSTWADEAMYARQPGWTGWRPGTKIDAVQWLRCCQMSYEEALPFLYSKNTFIIGPALDLTFHISRVLLPEYTSLMTSMEISFIMTMPHTAPPDLIGDWAIVHPAFFATLENSFPHLNRLRLKLGLKPWHMSEVRVTDESVDRFLEPWEKLASGRTWKQLELCVTRDWYHLLGKKAEAQNVWTLLLTVYGEKISLPCHSEY